MTAFLFPGQGSQRVGMGADLYEAYPQVRDLYDEAVSILGYDLPKISFEGPEERLGETQITQPALFVHSVALDLLLKDKGIQPEAAAGHSLGEYAAVVSAGALTFADALAVVKVRAEEMAQAGAMVKGTMAAILGATEEQIEAICQQAAAVGVVVPANLNSPGQVVLSGDVTAIDEALILAKDMGIRRAIKLKVSGAFHSPLMAPARPALQAALEAVPVRDADIPVYQNVVAGPVRSARELSANLLSQLENPVLWELTIRQMWVDGFHQFYEVGPGNILQGLHRRIVPDSLILGLDSAVGIERINVPA